MVQKKTMKVWTLLHFFFNFNNFDKQLQSNTKTLFFVSNNQKEILLAHPRGTASDGQFWVYKLFHYKQTLSKDTSNEMIQESYHHEKDDEDSDEENTFSSDDNKEEKKIDLQAIAQLEKRLLDVANKIHDQVCFSRAIFFQNTYFILTFLSSWPNFQKMRRARTRKAELNIKPNNFDLTNFYF